MTWSANSPHPRTYLESETKSPSGSEPRRGAARSVSPLAAMALGPLWIGYWASMTVLTVAVVSVVASSAWRRSVSTSPRSSSNEDSMPEIEDTACQHPLTKRMLVNNVAKCAACDEWLYSGICPKCQRALDLHNLRDELAPICPKAGELVAP